MIFGQLWVRQIEECSLQDFWVLFMPERTESQRGLHFSNFSD